VVAVGEIGLDYYRDLSPRLVQRRVFQEQLAIASGLDLPIIVHNRDSTLDLLHILHQEGSAYRGVIHSFLGDSELAAKFLSLGFHLGIGGPITFSKSGGLREAVERIPIERLLLETDCPYLAPSPHRGKRNEPTYLHFVVEKVAEIKGVSVENVRKRTTENAVNLFSLSA
jgi:TatD DNase family protein